MQPFYIHYYIGKGYMQVPYLQIRSTPQVKYLQIRSTLQVPIKILSLKQIPQPPQSPPKCGPKSAKVLSRS